MIEKGLIQIYTGSSKRYNFAPMGLILRAIGHGFRIYMAIFTPNDHLAAISKAVQRLKSNIELDTSPIASNVKKDRLELTSAIRIFETVQNASISGDFDIVILDGIHPLLSKNKYLLENVLRFIEERPPGVEMVFTGPYAPLEMIKKSHLVTEMKEIPIHHKNNGHNGSAPVDVITGNGKGKTTYALGAALLNASQDIPAAIIQFIKTPKSYGEAKAISTLPHLEIMTMGKGFLFEKLSQTNKKHAEAANKALDFSVEKILSRRYQLVVLDEINIAIDHGLIESRRIVDLLIKRPKGLHLILTGRNAHATVKKHATSVIEMKQVKHPFENGISARKGIEF
jgi:cob(I)alamin adenosyltransferase